MSPVNLNAIVPPEGPGSAAALAIAQGWEVSELPTGTVTLSFTDLEGTANTQRWAPEEVLHPLVEAEIAGRDESNLRNRLKAAGFPGRQGLR